MGTTCAMLLKNDYPMFYNILWVRPKVCVDSFFFSVSWDMGTYDFSKNNMVIWLLLKHRLVYRFIDAVNKIFAVSNILTSVAQDRYLWLFAVVLVKSILTRWAIFLHERSCIWLIYWGKLKFMCVNLCKIMKSTWFMNHILRYSDLNSVTIFIIFLRE